MQTPSHRGGGSEAPASQRISPPNVALGGQASRERDSFYFGTRALALVAELKRAEWLPAYDHEGVREVLEECTLLFNLFDEMAHDVGEEYEGDGMVMNTFNVYRLAIARNKRCLLVYHQYRWDRIQSVIWERGGTFPADLQVKLAPSEIQTMNSYMALTAKYQQNVNAMLFSDLQPPKDLFIEVRVLRDAGEIVTSSGDFMSLQQGATLFVRRAEVETLIRTGSLKHT